MTWKISMRFLAILFCVISKQHAAISFNINFRDVPELDDVFVEMRIDADSVAKLAALEQKENYARFYMPNTVPGTYQIQNWGRMLRDVQAQSLSGQELNVRAEAPNLWHIEGLIQDGFVIRYRVLDSADENLSPHLIWDMAATNFLKKGAVANLFGICGFIKGLRFERHDCLFHLPKDWEFAVALVTEEPADDQFSCSTKNYYDLVDAPVLLGFLAQRRSILEDGEQRSDILLAAYQESLAVAEQYVSKAERDALAVIAATHRWIGKMPTDRYAFLFYLTQGMSMMAGALEHRQSSLYVLPPFDMGNMLPQIMAHEYFHTITPLHIRSARIDEFNFINPQPPRHLWFYEGYTEYVSHLLMLNSGIGQKRGFMTAMKQKFHQNEMRPKGVSLEALSLGCLTTYQNHYLRVYDTAALVCMALDLEILRQSNGALTSRDIVRVLLERYKDGAPFDDETFITQWSEISGLDLQPFFDRYVLSAEEPPYEELLAEIGLRYRVEEFKRIPVFPLPDVRMSAEGPVVQAIPEDWIEKDHGGFQVGDLITHVNGVPCDIAHSGQILMLQNKVSETSQYIIQIIRDKKKMSLEMGPAYERTYYRHQLSMDLEATDEQKRRFAFLYSDAPESFRINP